MKLKKITKALLFPHIAIMIALIPIAAVLLLLTALYLENDSPLAILSYAVSAYALTVWCIKMPRVIAFFKAVKNENRYVRRYFDDPRLRVHISLYGSFYINVGYGLFHLWLGVYHRTFWFSSLGVYYLCLGAMRFFLLSHTKRYAPGERQKSELLRYRACGRILLVMNLALSLIVFFMVYWGRTFSHHMITAIAIAAYTFTAFTLAIVQMVKFKKYKSPVFSASKAISFAAACVSMLTLTSTLLTAFSDGSMGATEQKIMLGCVGIAVMATVLTIAVHMIARGTRELKKMKEETENGQK
ncbi:MAG: hypothetical protein J6J66_01985 [Clostridia bacterium]|nr:hypothetical protein [Clostridia bacterium]